MNGWGEGVAEGNRKKGSGMTALREEAPWGNQKLGKWCRLRRQDDISDHLYFSPPPPKVSSLQTPRRHHAHSCQRCTVGNSFLSSSSSHHAYSNADLGSIQRLRLDIHTHTHRYAHVCRHTHVRTHTYRPTIIRTS